MLFYRITCTKRACSHNFSFVTLQYYECYILIYSAMYACMRIDVKSKYQWLTSIVISSVFHNALYLYINRSIACVIVLSCLLFCLRDEDHCAQLCNCVKQVSFCISFYLKSFLYLNDNTCYHESRAVLFYGKTERQHKQYIQYQI